jgi:hypothetical protein
LIKRSGGIFAGPSVVFFGWRVVPGRSIKEILRNTWIFNVVMARAGGRGAERMDRRRVDRRTNGKNHIIAVILA